MKVVMLCLYPLHGVIGGVAEHTYKLTKALGETNKINLYIISFGDTDSLLCDGNVIIKIVKRQWFYYLFPPLSVMRLAREVSNIEPDIIHVQGSNISPYTMVASLLRNRHPFVLAILGIVSKESIYGNGVKHYIWTFFSKITERYVVSKTRNIIVEAKSIKDLVSEWTKSKIYIVPSGIEFKKIQEVHLRLIENPDIFLASRMVKIKGIDILIKSVPIVTKSIPNLCVYIAGSGPQENELKYLIKKLNIENHVKFLGFISEEKKYQYYKACKLVVVPSRWDCQPITLFETAASGKAVIASDMSNPGIVEDGKTGFIFESENVEDLANMIVILLKNEQLREEMGKMAEERVKQYDWTKLAQRYVEIYEEVIADFHSRKI